MAHTRNWRTAALATLALIAASLVAVSASTPAAAACTRTASDFNGDGFADAVAPEPFADEGGKSEVGAVRILYGKSSGISSTSNQLLDEASFSSLITPQNHDQFGANPVSGFFNNDCFADLVIGIPEKDNSIGTVVGEVVVIYGSATGLNVASAKTFTQVQLGGTAGNMAFGAVLAAGDFNGDGITDVAIGAPGADVGGAVGILYGSSTGLTLTGHAWITQDSPGVPGTGEPFDSFGTSIAAGDFNGDGHADLAVGVPFESLGTLEEAGDVVVLLGSKSGLTGTGATSWSQNSPGVPGTAEENDNFGTEVAAGDITGDGKADLVIGDEDESVGSISEGGSVTVLHGATGGVTGTGAQAWTESTAGVPGTEQQLGLFGEAVAVGDFNGDGHADVAIGSDDTVGTATGAGSVTILLGKSTGLTSTGAQYWDQNTAGISGTAEMNDGFGQYLQVANVVSHTFSGLVIGVPSEDTGTFTNNGAIEVMRGGSTGLTASGSQFFDSAGLVGGAEDNEQMGAAWMG